MADKLIQSINEAFGKCNRYIKCDKSNKVQHFDNSLFSF